VTKTAHFGWPISLAAREPYGVGRTGDKAFQLEVLPDVWPYEALVFGWAVAPLFLSPVLTEYSKKAGLLEGK